MGLLTGFIEGAMRWESGDPLTTKVIPFQSSIENATFNYTGELLESKTFNSRGLKVSTAACLTGVSASFEFSTTNITFGFLQAAAATLAENATDEQVLSESFVLPTGGALTLEFEPVTGSAVVALSDGTILPSSTLANVVTVTTPGANIGKRVTVNYFKEVGAVPERVIKLGSGAPLPVVGLYGRFFSCEESYLIQANRVIVVPNLSLSTGDNAAEVSFTATCLADETDTLATLIKYPLVAAA